MRVYNGLWILTAGPYRRDKKHLVLQPVEQQNDCRPNEKHIRQFQRGMRRAGQLFYEANGLITEVAHEAGQRWGQFIRNIHPAFCGQSAQSVQRRKRGGDKRVPVGHPLGVNLGFVARGTEYEVRRKADQAMAAAGFPAFNGFKDKIAAFCHKQL